MQHFSHTVAYRWIVENRRNSSLESIQHQIVFNKNKQVVQLAANHIKIALIVLIKQQILILNENLINKKKKVSIHFHLSFSKRTPAQHIYFYLTNFSIINMKKQQITQNLVELKTN